MTHTIAMHFDGKVLVPDEPVQLLIGQPLRVHVEVSSTTGKFADLLNVAADLPDASSDLADQHDHYLYGTPKKTLRSGLRWLLSKISCIPERKAGRKRYRVELLPLLPFCSKRRMHCRDSSGGNMLFRSSIGYKRIPT